MPVWDSSKESFERMPFVTACLTYMGFYLLMLLGLINQLLFTPKVAKEKYREVSVSARGAGVEAFRLNRAF